MSTRKIASLVMGAVLAAALPAHAKDVCVIVGESAYWRFVKVKPPKKPGAVTPLNGYFIQDALLAPVTGTAVRRSDGLILVGVYVHSQAPALTLDGAATLIVDERFTGSGKVRDDGETATFDIVWSGIDCKSAPLP